MVFRCRRARTTDQLRVAHNSATSARAPGRMCSQHGHARGSARNEQCETEVTDTITPDVATFINDPHEQRNNYTACGPELATQCSNGVASDSGPRRCHGAPRHDAASSWDGPPHRMFAELHRARSMRVIATCSFVPWSADSGGGSPRRPGRVQSIHTARMLLRPPRSMEARQAGSVTCSGQVARSAEEAARSAALRPGQRHSRLRVQTG